MLGPAKNSFLLFTGVIDVGGIILAAIYGRAKFNFGLC
jgi:hypothetical protein